MLQHVGKRSVSVGSFERGGCKLSTKKDSPSISNRHQPDRGDGGSTDDHFVNEDPKRPPIHRGCMARPFDHFRSDVLCFPTKTKIISLRPTELRKGGGTQKKEDEPSVPTNEFVRKSAMHDRVSTIGIYIPPPSQPHSTGVTPKTRRGRKQCERTPVDALVRISAGAPPGSPDCFERSKSESMIWPD